MINEEKSESRKRFLKLMATGALALPLATPFVNADMFIRREDSSTLNFNDIRPLPIFTEGAIPFSNSQGNLIENSSSLFWNDSTERLGVSTTSPNSTLHNNGSFSVPITITSINYTADDEDSTIVLDASSNNVTLTLPTASGINGRIYNIKCSNDTNTCNIQTSGSETIDGETEPFELYEDEIVTVQSDGTNWRMI